MKSILKETPAHANVREALRNLTALNTEKAIAIDAHLIAVLETAIEREHDILAENCCDCVCPNPCNHDCVCYTKKELSAENLTQIECEIACKK